jgi:5-methyltetrahydrofolate--homocysteine methyltransferase
MNTQIKPHSLGVNQINQIHVDEIHPWINRKLLFFKLWGFTPDIEKDASLKQDIEKTLERMRIYAQSHTSLSVAYGIFPCQSDGDMIKIYKTLHENCNNCSGCSIAGKQQSQIIKTLFFDRDIESKNNICDYISSVHSNLMDYIGFQVVTSGEKAVLFANQLKASDQYQDYFYWYGYCAAITEALAGWTHAKIRKEMGIAQSEESIKDEWVQNYRGKRYSFGYNWCRDMSEQNKVLDLIRAEDIGITMNDSDELEPEFSTCAVIIHHSEAIYW